MNDYTPMNNLLSLEELSPCGIQLFPLKSFEEAQQAVQALKTGKMLLVNLASLDVHLAQRLADYLAGSILALSGQHTHIGKEVHLFAPPTFTINAVGGH